MDTPLKHCEACGSQLPPEVKFCVQCGSPVPEEIPAQPDWISNLAEPETPKAEGQPPPVTSEPSSDYTAPTLPEAYYTPAPPLTTTPTSGFRNRLPCLLIAGAALLGLICVCSIAVVAFLSYYPISSRQSVVTTEVVVDSLPTVVVPSITPIESPGETQGPSPSDGQSPSPTDAVLEPTQEQPDATLPSAGSGQAYTDDFSIFDPFADNQLAWETDSADDLTTKVENGAYSMYTNETSTYFWVYPPVDFDPIVLEYDAWVDGSTSKEEIGTYGVVCNLQDSSNFTFVEVDPSDGTVYFARFENDEEISLRDQDWSELNNLLIGTDETNHLMVECYPDSISLFINDTFEASVSIEPPASPGRSGIMIGTWETIDPDGFKVFFDNFYAYIPQQ